MFQALVVNHRAVHNRSGKVCIIDIRMCKICIGKVGISEVGVPVSGIEPFVRVRSAAIGVGGGKAGIGKVCAGKIRFMYLAVPQVSPT